MRRLIALIRAAREADIPTPERLLELERERRTARVVSESVYVRNL